MAGNQDIPLAAIEHSKLLNSYSKIILRTVPFPWKKYSGSAHRIYVNLTYLPDDSSLSVVIGKEMNCYDDRKKIVI